MNRATVEIEFTPFVCADCGQLRIMSDLERSNRPGNCDSCQKGNIYKAGPMQLLKVKVYREAVPKFARGEK